MKPWISEPNPLRLTRGFLQGTKCMLYVSLVSSTRNLLYLNSSTESVIWSKCKLNYGTISIGFHLHMNLNGTCYVEKIFAHTLCCNSFMWITGIVAYLWHEREQQFFSFFSIIFRLGKTVVVWKSSYSYWYLNFLDNFEKASSLALSLKFSFVFFSCQNAIKVYSIYFLMIYVRIPLSNSVLKFSWSYSYELINSCSIWRILSPNNNADIHCSIWAFEGINGVAIILYLQVSTGSCYIFDSMAQLQCNWVV